MVYIETFISDILLDSGDFFFFLRQGLMYLADLEPPDFPDFTF